MSCNTNSPNVNKTFVIEPLSITGGSPVWSACTAFYTSFIKPCGTGDTVTFGVNVNIPNGGLYLSTGSTEYPALHFATGGTFLNTVKPGSFEFVGNNLYFTDLDGLRRNILLGASGTTATTFDALTDTSVAGASDGNLVYFDGSTNFWRNTNIISINDDTNTVTINNNLFATNLSGNTIYSGGTDLLNLFTTQTTFNSHVSNFNTHTGDTSIHYPKSAITLSELGSSAHTHTLSEITDFNTYSGNVQTLLGNKVEQSLFNSYTAATDIVLSGKVDNGVNIGGGKEIFSGKSGTTLVYRTLSGGTNTTITQYPSVVKIDVEPWSEDTLVTTADTLTTISTFSGISTDSSRFVINYVTAHLDTNNYGFWKRTIALNNVSGNITIELVVSEFDKQSSGLTPTDLVYSAIGSTVIAQVNGEIGKTYNWTSKWEII